MGQPEKRKWDYVLCYKCPAGAYEYFVIGGDVGKQGVGMCPECGTEVYHVICDGCGDSFEINKRCAEFHA